MSSGVCDLRLKPDRRVRRYCPHCRQQCYGRLVTMADTTRVLYDCGTLLDTGYRYWQHPRTGKRGQPIRRSRPLLIPWDVRISLSGRVQLVRQAAQTAGEAGA